MAKECYQCKAEVPEDSKVCPKCGTPYGARLDYATGQPYDPVTRARELNEQNVLHRPISGLALLGWLLIIAGICGAYYFFFDFSTVVTTPTTTILGQTVGGDQINNLGLMSDRQNGIIVSIGAAILGAILIVASRMKANP